MFGGFPKLPSVLISHWNETEFRKGLYITIIVLLQPKDTNQNQPKEKMQSADSGTGRPPHGKLVSSGMHYPSGIYMRQYVHKVLPTNEAHLSLSVQRFH